MDFDFMILKVDCIFYFIYFLFYNAINIEPISIAREAYMQLPLKVADNRSLNNAIMQR